MYKKMVLLKKPQETLPVGPIVVIMHLVPNPPRKAAPTPTWMRSATTGSESSVYQAARSPPPGFEIIACRTGCG
jgi:hypothetical protein